MLADADAALEVWSRRWGVHSRYDATYPGLDMGRNSTVHFHFHATRFWIRMTALRIIQYSRHTTTSSPPHPSASSSASGSSSPSSPSLLHDTLSLVLQSASAAEHVCRHLSDLSPLHRDSARYMADAGFAFIAFCACYLVRVYELFGRERERERPDQRRPPRLDLGPALRTVAGTGRLLAEMGIAGRQVPVAQGRYVLARLAQAQATAEGGGDEMRELPPRWRNCDLAFDFKWLDGLLMQTAAGEGTGGHE